jgi:hypothetical protein
MQYIELVIQSNQIINKIRIVATDGRSIECEVEHIEGERYKMVTNIEQAIELTSIEYKIIVL